MVFGRVLSASIAELKDDDEMTLIIDFIFFGAVSLPNYRDNVKFSEIRETKHNRMVPGG